MSIPTPPIVDAPNRRPSREADWLNPTPANRKIRMRFIRDLVQRRWVDYMARPPKLTQNLWTNISRRFGMVDLVGPAAKAIYSGLTGGVVVRVIDGPYREQIQAFMATAKYQKQIKAAALDAVLYGNGYLLVGRDRRGRPSIVTLPAIDTEIETDEDDVRDIIAIEAGKRRWDENGMYRKAADGRRGQEWTKQPGTDCGFIPVAMFRPNITDPGTPYGESLVWPAAEETRQVTYLTCDQMVLSRTQAFSTLVIQGRTLDNPEERAIGPFSIIRLDPSDVNATAKYITPDAKISEIDSLVDSKFERCAVQCSVPIEVFQAAKSGANQKTGAAHLTHKPLYDLVLSLQDELREFEQSVLGLIAGLIAFEESGAPVDLDAIAAAHTFSIGYQNEVSPAITQEDSQVWTMLLHEDLVDFPRARRHFNPEDTDETIAAAAARRDSRLASETGAGLEHLTTV